MYLILMFVLAIIFVGIFLYRNKNPTPTMMATYAPTMMPTMMATYAPTMMPTMATYAPTMMPTYAPTMAATMAPTMAPTIPPMPAKSLPMTFPPIPAPPTLPTTREKCQNFWKEHDKYRASLQKLENDALMTMHDKWPNDEYFKYHIQYTPNTDQFHSYTVPYLDEVYRKPSHDYVEKINDIKDRFDIEVSQLQLCRQ